MAIANPIYMEHPDLPKINGRPAYQLLPDAPGVQAIQEARGWVVKDLPPELDPDSPNTGLTVHKPPEEPPAAPPVKKTKPADSKAGQSKNEGDDG